MSTCGKDPLRFPFHSTQSSPTRTISIWSKINPLCQVTKSNPFNSAAAATASEAVAAAALDYGVTWLSLYGSFAGARL